MILASRYLLGLVAAVGLAACSNPAGNAPAAESSASPDTHVVEHVATAPTVGALLAREKQASEAYFRGDGAFFEGLLSDNQVMRNGGTRIGKADVVNMISLVKCEIKDGWTLTEPHLQKINSDAYVLSYISTMAGSCTSGGVAFTQPSPVRASTLWIRNGENWQTAFHSENPILDPANPPPRKNNELTSEQNEASAAAAPDARGVSAADPATDALMAAENAFWKAWMEKDAVRLTQLSAADISFVNIFGTFFPSKAAALADWTGTTCQVTSFSLIDGVGTLVSPTVGVLTLKATVNGDCGGRDISGQTIYGNTIYVKDGDTWKWVFGFNSPA